jgi:predicted lipase
LSEVLVKKRSGEFVKVSAKEADKLIEDGKAVAYDLKTSRHEPFKPFKVDYKKLTKKKKLAKEKPDK